jgi:ribulose-5-phosphate 4-epimerase/fuculose-1-phosphate aldolase
MRVGRLPLLSYHAPVDHELEAIAEKAAADSLAVLLRNHGPIVAGSSVCAALDALEEIEETAKLFLLLQGMRTSPISEDQRVRLSPLRT